MQLDIITAYTQVNLVSTTSTANAGDKSAIALLLAESFLRGIGMDYELIPLAAKSLMSRINPIAVDSVEKFLIGAPGYSVHEAIDILLPSLKNKDTLLMDGNSTVPHKTLDHGSAQAEPELKNQSDNNSAIETKAKRIHRVQPVVQYEDDSIEGELILASEPSTLQTVQEDEYPPLLFGHHPPKNIDLHPEMTLRTGLFRTLPSGRKHPALDESQIYELMKPLKNGSKFMSMKGPVLNSGIDLTNYLCLTHWFGRMNKEEYEASISNPVVMSLEDFFSPIPENLRPTDYLVNKQMIDSFDRVKTIRLHFYPSISDAEGLNKNRSVMIANLAGTLHVRGDGMIEISPTPELRNLYTSTRRLIHLNRTSVIGLASQMARLLGMWLAAKPGFNQEWTEINIKISVKSLLQEIHPKEKHTMGDLRLLSSALDELSASGLIKYEIIIKNSKTKKEIKNLTLASILYFSHHRFSNKTAFVSDQPPVLIAPKAKKQVKPNYKAGQLLVGLPFLPGNALKSNLEAWDELHKTTIDEIMLILKKKSRVSLNDAREQLHGTRDNSRKAFARTLLRSGRKDDYDLFIRITSINPQKKQQSEIETMIRSLPLVKGSAKEWYSNNKQAIGRIFTELGAIKGPQHVLSIIHKRVIYGRLITPLELAGEAKKSVYIRGLFDMGRDSVAYD